MFPNLHTRVLCQLAEIVDICHSTVLELVPGASVAQICALLRIAEDSKNKVRGGGRCNAPKSPMRDAYPDADETISLIENVNKSY